MRSFRLALLALLVFVSIARAQAVRDLRVGQWVELKGEMAADGRFVVASMEVLPPDDTEVLIGLVTEIDHDRQRLTLLRTVIHLSDKTEWKGVAFDDLVGKRVKVAGHFRGAGKFSGRTVELRETGRDRITGRLDTLEETAAGLEGSVLQFKVAIPHTVKFENTEPFLSKTLAPPVVFDTALPRSVESDDYIPGSREILENLFLGALVESKAEGLRNHDLDDDVDSGVWKNRFSARVQLLWTPTERFTALFTTRFEASQRWDELYADSRTESLTVHELWGAMRDVLVDGVDVKVGRQEFADDREWLYKANLDSVRVNWNWSGWRLDLAAARPLPTSKLEFNTQAETYLAELRYGTDTRHVSGYVMDRRDDQGPPVYPIHFGLRAFGDWIPGAKSWLEASVLRGYDDVTNLEGFAVDFGTSWKLPFAPGFYAIGAYALASGDDAATPDVDESFRQTGLHNNNAKLGGVTSYKYYGELLDPELSNLHVVTLGIGTRIARKNSIDLVWHGYRQDVASPILRDTALKPDPDGIHTGLGQEIDLVFGSRALASWDFEVVFGWFDPGAAFPAGDDAWFGSVQVKCRL